MIQAEVPEKIRADIPGANPVYFYPDDFVDFKYYEKLIKGSPFLKAKYFKDCEVEVRDGKGVHIEHRSGKDTFKRYFLIASALTEGTVIVNGKERSGKSLFAYHLAYQRRELFGIPAVFNRKPKESFGKYEIMPDADFKEELDYFNELVADIEASKLDDDNDLPPELEKRARKSKFYGKTYVNDEAYKDVARDHVTNRTRANGELVRQYGHLHTLFIFISPDENDIAGKWIFDRKTHQVKCRYSLGKCHYVIEVNTPKVSGFYKTMQLDPKEWEKLWKSDNLVGFSNFRFH